MMTSTHAVSGAAAWLTLVAATTSVHHIHPGVVAAGTLLAWGAAKAPDIDNPGSRPARQVDRLIPGLSEWLSQAAGHRGVTHWGVTAVILGALSEALFSALNPALWVLGLAVGLGWLAHILGDCLTWAGTPLLAPFRAGVVRPPYGWRFETGGVFERQIVRPLLWTWALVALIAYIYTLI